MRIPDNKDKRNMLLLKLYLEQEYFEKLEELAKQYGVKTSDLARIWIKERLIEL